jgi:uncharacterized membrane protein YphA (DoxX/SURF4 family)
MAFELMFLIGRILVGGFYLMSGMNHFSKNKMMTDYAKSKNVPFPQIAVIVSGFLLLLASLSFLFGVYPRIGVLLAALFFIPTLFFMHNFWAVPKKERMEEMINFMRVIALLGATLMFLQISLPWPISLNF